jgi:hypothetical protein
MAARLIERLPSPPEVHKEIGEKLRELSLLRRLLRLSSRVNDELRIGRHRQTTKTLDEEGDR